MEAAMRERKRVGLALLSLLTLATTARADDAPAHLLAAVKAADESAAADAKAVDAVLASGDYEGWTHARDRFVDRIAESLANLEKLAAEAAAMKNPGPSLAQPIAGMTQTHDRLSRARLLYLTMSLMARSASSEETRASAFAKMREAEGASFFLTLPSGLDALKSVMVPVSRRKQELTKSADNVSALLKYYIADGAGIVRPWPMFNGKAFVLWLVATDQLDRRDPRQLVILFSPHDAERSLEKAGGVAAYAGLNLDSLRSGGIDVSKLTSYVGRRNREKEHLLSASELERGAAVIADLSFGDVAIVGFVNGQVKTMTKADLGLGPDDPLVAGDASKSPILRDLGE
jgi:hypothetical protein